MPETTAFQKVLIANRGEIARRICRTLKRLGIVSVAVYHCSDKDSPFVKEAEEAYEIMGETPTSAYLDIKQIVEIASSSQSDAIHPGYGFLAENGDFAAAIASAGMTFIGPRPDAISLMGNKVASRKFVERHGFPLAPSIPNEANSDALLAAAEAIGFPVLIKAAAGGGGKGMHIVYEPGEFKTAFDLATSEAERYFGDPQVYCEKYLVEPRHIEVQILADEHGRCVHLGERECSVQRRFQKIIEETPAPNLSAETRKKICNTAVDIAKAANYTNAGTVEFIMDADEKFYFLEMNTRLQVEHPVTEMVTGLDLVEQQIRIAEGHALNIDQADITFTGHAIELRICAEDADADFVPATGSILYLQEASGDGLRFDSSLEEGTRVTTAFDPMLAKLIAHGNDRDAARERLLTALKQLVILGVTTNTAFLGRVLSHPQFIEGHTHTHFLADYADSLKAEVEDEATLKVLLASAALNDPHFRTLLEQVPEPYGAIGAWRNG